MRNRKNQKIETHLRNGRVTAKHCSLPSWTWPWWLLTRFPRCDFYFSTQTCRNLIRRFDTINVWSMWGDVCFPRLGNRGTLNQLFAYWTVEATKVAVVIVSQTLVLMPGLRLSHSAGKNKQTFRERKLFAYPKHSSQNTRAIKEMLQLPIQNPIEQSYCDLYHQAVSFVLLLKTLFFFGEASLRARCGTYCSTSRAQRGSQESRDIPSV